MREYLIYSKKTSSGDLNFMGQIKAMSKESALATYEKANRKIKYPVVITKNNVVEGSLWK